MTLPSNPTAAFIRRNPHLYPPSCPVVPSEHPKPAKRIRQSSAPLMNKLETEFYATLHEFENVMIQALRFKLGNGIWYKPDFCTIFAGVVHCWEVKGPHSFRGGMENLKVAAGLYPQIRWILVWDQDGAWCQQTVLP